MTSSFKYRLSFIETFTSFTPQQKYFQDHCFAQSESENKRTNRLYCNINGTGDPVSNTVHP